MIEFITLLMNFIVKVAFDLMIFVVMFQFLLELMGAQSHHPLRLLILRYTKPLMDPLHHFIPSYKNIDLALLLVLFLLEYLKLLLLFLLAWQFPNLVFLIIWSLLLLLNTFLNFYFFAIFLRLIVSWVVPIYTNHPILQILFILTEPILRPIRNRVHIKKFDWTPLVAIVVIKIISMLITHLLILLGAPGIIL